MNVFIQGAGRGLGLAIAKEAKAAGATHLFLTARNPENSTGYSVLPPSQNVTWLTVDFTDTTSIERAGSDVCNHVDHLSYLICTAGVLRDDQTMPEKRINDLDLASMLHSYQTNAAGPILMTKALWPTLKGTHPVKVASLSARVGSITDNRLGGWYSYRASKAAQNQLMHTMAIELARANKLSSVAMLHPGTVDTDLSRPFHKNVPAGKLFTTDHSAACLWQVVNNLTPADSGGFFAYDGSSIPF